MQSTSRRRKGHTSEAGESRQVKSLNTLIEQDHRFMKRFTKPGMGFFSLETAWRTLQGYMEVLAGSNIERKIRSLRLTSSNIERNYQQANNGLACYSTLE